MSPETIAEQFAVMNNAYVAWSFDYFLDSMERLGLNHIDLWGGVQHFDAFAMDAGKNDAFRRRLEARGMRVIAYTPELLAYPFNFASPEACVRRASVDYAKRNIEICAALECGIMLLSPGWGLQDIPLNRSRQWSDDCLFILAEHARGNGIRLALEHLTPQSSNLLTNCGAVIDTLRRVDHPALGIVLDLGQMSLFGEQVEDYMGPLGNKLFHVHIMDGTPASHLAFGDGVLPLESYHRTLLNAGYTGHFTLEINDGRYAARPHEALAQCVAGLCEWS